MQPPPAPAPQQHPWPLPRRRRPPGALVIDVAIVALVGTAQVTATVMAGSHHGVLGTGQRHLDALGITLLVISALVLAARRQRPVPVLVVTAGAVMLYNLLGYPHGVSFLSLYAAFYTAVVTGHRLAAWVGAAVLSVHLWLSWIAGYPMSSGLVVWGIAGLLIVLGFGEMTRLRRAYLGSLRQRAIEAERTRDEAGRRMVSEERLHIARELHDLIGHNISLINVQASVALHLLERQPEQAAVALTAIKQVSKDTLDELRLVVGAVRGTEDEGSPRLPARGLGDLDALVSGAAAADLDVRMEVAGSPRPVPAGLGLTAFRIVQESLTNVRRHAGPASVAVRLEYNTSDLTVRIEDSGRGLGEAAAGYGGTGYAGAAGHGGTPDHGGAPNGGGVPNGGGRGLTGMRERAAAVGGELDAGPRPDGGFQVVARLPLDPALGGTS
ncbi:MAG TPA: histidine kinase [Streptosporangiaceae bacterium]